MSEDGEDSLREQNFATADEDEAEERSATHRSLGVVEEAKDARVVKLVRVILDEEVA